MEKYLPVLLAGFAVLFSVGLVFFTGKKKQAQPEEQAKAVKVGGMPGDPTPFIRMAPYYHVSLIVAGAVFLGILVLFPVGATMRSLVNSNEGVSVLIRAFIFGMSLFLAFLFSLLKNNLD